MLRKGGGVLARALRQGNSGGLGSQGLPQVCFLQDGFCSQWRRTILNHQITLCAQCAADETYCHDHS